MAAIDRTTRQPEPVTSRPSEGVASGFGRSPADAVGILKTTVLPSLGLHGGLSIITYGIARATNRVDLKDWLWPSGMVLNAWWTAVGRHVIMNNDSAGRVFAGLSFYQQALLGAVTLWGGRLLTRIVSRCLKRKEDDPRYQHLKQEPGLWNTTAVLQFGVEAVAQAVIALPFTLPFNVDHVGDLSGPTRDIAVSARWLAAGLFTAGLTLETLADWQLESHKEKQLRETGQDGDLCRDGVWSIVRHPNYLGDALVHFSFPLWAYGSRLFSPWMLLGPVANYAFLRFIGGDKENEASQLERYSAQNPKKYAQLRSWQQTENSFWPSLVQVANPWTIAVVGVGALGAFAQSYLEGVAAGTAPGLAEGMRTAYVTSAP
ncbi:DUF1295-domain-containing protein [Teratosphaeria destructans]|uniref:DUF1295-domain-containing protein n=1 Tax=Teratosphaeria destructans TaxID=418781 RepID=A0A9W7W1R7_9PEZI|nr:DUF1295-domain-containing protein [Teratosphaeria destructans]